MLLMYYRVTLNRAYFCRILGCEQPSSMSQIIADLNNLFILFHTNRGSEPPSGKKNIHTYCRVDPKNPTCGLMFWVQRVIILASSFLFWRFSSPDDSLVSFREDWRLNSSFRFSLWCVAFFCGRFFLSLSSINPRLRIAAWCMCSHGSPGFGFVVSRYACWYGVTPRVWPDLRGFTRFEAGNEDEHDEQIEGKHTHKIHTGCPRWPDSPTQ
jgi:hypothetical protein